MPNPIRELESYIHDATLKDIIAAFLYGATVVADNEEVLELQLSEPNADGVRSIKFKIIENREVELIIHS